MCGIAGIINIKHEPYDDLQNHLTVMNKLQSHRGPDGKGLWEHENKFLGFAHRRLSIIDLETGAQPMTDYLNNTIVYNGEIYNYIELRNELSGYQFKTSSDTEVILAAYSKWGTDCVNHLRGMFAFTIWDDNEQKLFCSRDRFGIKPFYYTIINSTFYFASEAKALLPFMDSIETNMEAMKEYLFFQLYLEGKTLFKNINELKPGHSITIRNGDVKISRYWEVYYNLDFDHTSRYFEVHLKELIEDSVKVHLRSDVPIGAYLSGGIDSSVIASLASEMQSDSVFNAFTGKFSLGELYDESKFARALADMRNIELHELNITTSDFIDSIRRIIYYLDYPVAGPGSFPQYHVSKLASQYRKVVLGGQGGDEIFGGYARYLIAYFEQCIKGAIDGTLKNGNYVVTYESIIPNLIGLQNYKQLLKEFWKEGLFDDLDIRYFRLINRARSLNNEINWNELGNYSPFETFKKVFNGRNVGKESYFDKMTNFDFKTLLPALLHVEDRMSMAHGLESRVPFLDHPIVEFAATMPADIKFKDGTLKRALINSMKDNLPDEIVKRKNKMGFPVPLVEWAQNGLSGFIYEIFNTSKLKDRPYFNSSEIIKSISTESKFGRKLWGLLSLELWHQEFHDKEYEYKNLLAKEVVN